MLPATTPGVTARCAAISRRRASREMALATISTMWQKRPAWSDSRSGLRGTLPSEFFADELRSLNHRSQLGGRDILRKMQAAAIRQNEDALGRHELQSFANAFGNDLRCFDFMRLHIDHADAQLELVRELLEQLEIFTAAPREFESELLN